VNDEKVNVYRTGTDDVRRGMGAAIPQASRYDSRVQQVIYNPQNVTVVNTKPGFMTTLVFDNDEAVISAKPGFDEAWEATPDANRVNVRPVALTQERPERMATQRRS
jgi:type IV secretion system protein VirB9